MKRLECRDVGFDCDKVIEAESEAEVLRQAGEPVIEHHKTAVTPPLVEQVRGQIRDTDPASAERH